jgi:hypothetical protein
MGLTTANAKSTADEKNTKELTTADTKGTAEGRRQKK